MGYAARARENWRKCKAAVEEMRTKYANKNKKNPRYEGEAYIAKNQLKKKP